MAISKAHEFEKDEIKLAELAKALSHPARIAILKKLAEDNVCICGELVSDLPLAQSTVSQHLKELKRVGLVRGEIEGPKSSYCINPDTIAQLSGLIDKLFKVFDSCCPPTKLITIKKEK
ncbi:metalloregulator ArsR/SmtB family transcription factor [bacterium]|nr:metalloregulator ArsR/SmtB family transcription factor [bacterium]